MRAITVFIATAALALSATAMANPSVTPNTTNNGDIQVQHVRGSAYKIHMSDMAAYKGDYTTNAGNLRVSLEQRKLFAQIGGDAKAELVPVSENIFVTRDEQTKIVFDPLPFAPDTTPLR